MCQQHYLALGRERCLKHILFTQGVHSLVFPWATIIKIGHQEHTKNTSSSGSILMEKDLLGKTFTFEGTLERVSCS